MINTQDKYLIIGAGFVGLGIAQGLKQANINYDQVDKNDRLGGNWYNGVYETAHIISSKKVTQFTNFPMPKDYPNFPSAEQMLTYLQSFAKHFYLEENLEFNREITAIYPQKDNLWQVNFANQETRIYRGVIICNGHHWQKKIPEFKGTFHGKIIHSKDYKKPQQLQGKKVLVIGGGNSGCDIASESARVGLKSILSLRESIWFLPKTLAGIPLTDLVQTWMPDWVQRLIAYGAIKITFGDHHKYGLSKPNYRIFEKHPTLNNEVPYYIQHGKIGVKPAVKQLKGNFVEFIDGSQEEIDLIVCATGFQVSYPFLPPQLNRVEGAVVKCYAGSFLADYKGIYFIGWGQARGGVGSLISAYAPIFARLLKLEETLNIPMGLVFKSIGQSLPETHLSDPQKIFRQLKLLNLSFGLFKQIARQISEKNPDFANEIISQSNSEK